MSILSLIDAAKQEQPWDLGNKTLYDLCKQYPDHRNDKAIIAKVWIIGRTYAAAIERRRSRGKFEGDDFYTKNVVPKIKNSDIDEQFSTLKNYKKVSRDNIEDILKVHNELTGLFKAITKDPNNPEDKGLEKRSLASKYLHFHFPELFFIYDTRAVATLGACLKELGSISVNKKLKSNNADNEYRKFCNKCLAVTDHINEKHKVTLTPRELDNLLLALSAQKQ